MTAIVPSWCSVAGCADKPKRTTSAVLVGLEEPAVIGLGLCC